MTFHARTFTNADELVAHYKAVRHRLDNPVIAQAPAPVVAEPEVEKAPPPPPDPSTWILDATQETLALYDTILTSPHWSPRAKAANIVKAIATKHNLTVAEVMGNSRRRHIVNARQEAMAAIYTEFPMWSLPTIGRFFDRDHTTVLYSVKAMGAWR